MNRIIYYFYREVMDYEGARELDAMIKFVESGGTEGNEPAEGGDDDEDYDDEDVSCLI